MIQENSQVTGLLAAWRDGDADALDQLIPLVHDELRRLAARCLRGERADHSFDPTDLVHEAYLRLVGKTHPQWRDRAHFYAVAAKLMRRILVDHARTLKAAKRGGGMFKISLDQAGEPATKRADELIALDDALEALAAFDPQKARIIELRFFGGLSIKETAEVVGLSTASIIKSTRLARAWLHAEISQVEADSES